MKYKLTIQLLRCNEGLLADYHRVKDAKLFNEMNYEKDLKDGTKLKCQGQTFLKDRDITFEATYTGEGVEFEKKMADMVKQVDSGQLKQEFQKSFTLTKGSKDEHFGTLITSVERL